MLLQPFVAKKKKNSYPSVILLLLHNISAIKTQGTHARKLRSQKKLEEEFLSRRRRVENGRRRLLDHYLICPRMGNFIILPK